MSRRKRNAEKEQQKLENLLTEAYHVRPVEGGVEIHPYAHAGPGKQARISLALGLGFGMLLVGVWIFTALRIASMRDGPEFGPSKWLGWLCPGVLLLPIAGLAFAGAIKLWATRNIPLFASRSGRVRYGRRELVTAGSAARVRLERVSYRTTKGTFRWASLFVERTDGWFIELPSPYFSSFNIPECWELGESLAQALATALGVAVTREPLPENALRLPRQTR